MEITGKITSVSDLQKGTSVNGEWRSIDFVVEETDKQYSESAVLRCKGAMADKVSELAPFGGSVDGLWKAQFSMRARTFKKQNGDNVTVTDLTCWALNKVEG